MVRQSCCIMRHRFGDLRGLTLPRGVDGYGRTIPAVALQSVRIFAAAAEQLSPPGSQGPSTSDVRQARSRWRGSRASKMRDYPAPATEPRHAATQRWTGSLNLSGWPDGASARSELARAGRIDFYATKEKQGAKPCRIV